jgi:hypothetical protein
LAKSRTSFRPGAGFGFGPLPYFIPPALAKIVLLLAEARG